MKHLKRALSMLLVTLMIVTALPLSVIATAEPTEAAAPAAETETNTAAPAGLAGQDTDLTIDFNYAETYHIGSPEDALAKMGMDSQVNGSLVGSSYWNAPGNTYKWNHVTENLTIQDADPGSLRYFLESTDDAHKYIVLDSDFERQHSGNTPWKTIEINTNKVLDLNGHMLYMRADENMKNPVWDEETGAQTTHAVYHKAVMFEIKQGATLTIIDSGAEARSTYNVDGTYYQSSQNNEERTGGIKFTGYMVDPHKFDINYYTTRDLFNVNGTLVIYGGTYQAGRQKDQLKKNFSWSNLKTVIGSAVGLGVSIAEYGTGISAALASNDDLLESFKTEDIESGDNDGKDDAHTSTDKKTGEGGTKVTTKDTPKESGGQNTGTGRSETVSESKETKNQELASGDRKGTEEGENKANDKKTGKNDKNTKIAESEKKIVDSIINKDKITSIVDGAFEFVDGVVGLIGSDERSRVTNMIQGTVAHVGNTGTLVIYGGTFKGYGSTPNTRNAVIEVTKGTGSHPIVEGKDAGGLAYIYGGTFEAYAGANVFNMVRSANNVEVVQYERAKDNTPIVPKTVILSEQETMGCRQLFYDNEEEYAAYAKYIREHPEEEDTYPVVEPVPVSTRNVVVRGGTFRNYYEVMMVAAKTDDNDGHFTKFPGSSGSVNLGIESYGEDMIRDGRIQISDKYGDGPMVLLDDRVEEDQSANDGAYHYRLFCGDTELRYKRYLEVYPNKAQVNSSYSFQLQTFYGSQANQLLSNAWGSDEENIREAIFANTEEFFTFPIDHKDLSPTYYVMPHLTDTDVYGQKLNASEVWYYNTPLDHNGNMVQAPAVGNVVWTGKWNPTENSEGTVTQPRYIVSDRYDTEAYYKGLRAMRSTGKLDQSTEQYYHEEYSSVAQDMKWFTYKIYRVDPLTRESISEGGYGTDVPLATVKYGASRDSLKCKLPLLDMQEQMKAQAAKNGISWDGYKQGEMYRIVLEVQEYYAYDYYGAGRFENELQPAKAETSICFRCVSKDEQTGGGQAGFEPDYTALQWNDEPLIGQWASVKLVNAKAGQVDYRGDKIFDVYYQWYVVNDDGTETMIAGTDHVLRDPDANRQYHHPTYWDVENDGYTYVNTEPLPADKNDWVAEDLHMYTYQMCQARPEMRLYKNKNLHLTNNNVWFTNTDRCYIPGSLLGKTIRVKAIVENLKWTKNFDQQQVYYSHTIKVEEPITLKATVGVTTAEGVTFASTAKPATVSIATLENLDPGEYISSMYYYANGRMIYKENLHATQASQIPTVTYPTDFFGGSDAGLYIQDGEYTVNAVLFACRESNPGTTSAVCIAPKVNVHFAMENTGFVVTPGVSAYYHIDTVRDGALNGTIQPFTTVPASASIISGYADATSTDPNVAVLNENGYLMFPGGMGSTTISVTGPNGVTVSKTIKVYAEIDRFEIRGLRAPTLNQTLPIPTGGEMLPFDAHYHLVDVYWTKDRSSERLPATAKPENYHAYTIHVIVAPDNGYSSVHNPEYVISAIQADGSVEVRSGNKFNAYGEFGDVSGGLEFKYMYKAISGGAATVINKIYLDFPTQVKEGDSVDEWMQNVRFYTNGDDSVMEVMLYEVFYNILGMQRGSTYGDKVNVDTLHTFLPGVQTGFQIQLGLPTGMNVAFPTETDAIEIYVNGELHDTTTAVMDKLVWAIAANSIEVLPCTVEGVEKHVDPMPVYSLNGFDILDGEPVYVEDLLNSNDPRLTLQLVGISGTNGSEEYVYYDADQGCFGTDYGQTYGPEDPVTLTFNVLFDSDCDGIPEVVVEETATKYLFDDHGYGPGGQLPGEYTDTVQTVTAYNPDGTVAYTGQYTTPYTWGSKRYLSVPEVDGAFITSVGVGSGTADTSFGANRLRAAFSDNSNVSIYTVAADQMKVYASSTQVNTRIVSNYGYKVYGIYISLDGEHFTTAGFIDDLTPDTNYTLYYKQGPDGRVYQKAFHTAAEDYGLTIGIMPVTCDNLGNLAVDHWHYDPDAATLTLQDFTIAERGGPILNGLFFSLIFAEQPITVELFGDNYLTVTDYSEYTYGIYAYKDLTITGPGNLTITGPEPHDIIYRTLDGLSSMGDIYLNSSGTLTVINALGGVIVPKSNKVYYQNGNISLPVGVLDRACDLLDSGYIDCLSFENQLTTYGHSLTIKNSSGEVIDDYIAYVKSSDHDKSVTFTMSHSCTRTLAAAEYLVSGDCLSGATYHKSCSCGACGTGTFTVSAGSHSLTTHAAHAYDCAHMGWDEYHTCDKCGWTDYEDHVHYATGHTWVEHAAADPTCAQDGHPAYFVCSTCGASTLPAETPDEYKALGHVVIPVAVTPATCTEDGMLAHYECQRCGALFADVNGAIPTTAAALAQPCLGHTWGEPAIVQPTETEPGSVHRHCVVCGAEDVTVIPPLGDADPCGATVWWRLEGDVLTVYGIGEMYSYNGQTNNRPWSDSADAIRVVRIEEGVTLVGNTAFYNLPNLEEVYIAGSVTTVDASAFRNCAKLRKVEFADGTDDLTIWNYAFMNDTALEEITLPARLVELKGYAFRLCSGLHKVLFLGGAPTIAGSSFGSVVADVYYPVADATWTANVRQNYGGTLTWIGYLGMGYCGYEDDTHALEDVSWFLDENGVMTISGTGATKSCSSDAGGKPWADYLTQITALHVEEGVTSIGSFGFNGATNLQEINLAQTVVSINSAAFYGCTSLTSVTFPHRISGISSYAFRNCTALTEIYFTGAAPSSIYYNAFTGVTATAYYPVYESSWTSSNMTDYGGTLTWESYNPGPYFFTQPKDKTADLGATVNFSVAGRGQNVSYQWQVLTPGAAEWTNVNFAVSIRYVLYVTATAELNGAQFRCIATDDEGKTAISDAATLTVNLPAWEIVEQPEDYTGPVNEYAEFFVGVSNTAGLTYCWQILVNGAWTNVDLTDIVFYDSDSDTLGVLITAGLDGAQFRCVITDAAGNEVITDVATLHVEAVFEIITQPTDFTGPVGATATFHVEATGTGLTYQWQYKSAKDGKWYNASATGYNTDTMSIKVTTARNGMQFRCKVTDAFGQQLIT
ncbi:MAG: leucine-rich repeat domain-containing protein, partial [Oscillospiraceae bacterium]|nr:leucine-rich repeat domain-containing protein [Oscillospiraceae bacterium]